MLCLPYFFFFFYFKMHSTCNFPQHYENMSRTLTKNLQKQASLCAAHEQVWNFFLWHSFPSALTHINLPMQERNACRKVIKKWNYYCSEYLDRSKIESAFITYWQQKSHNLPHRKSLKRTRLHYPLFALWLNVQCFLTASPTSPVPFIEKEAISALCKKAKSCRHADVHSAKGRYLLSCVCLLPLAQVIELRLQISSVIPSVPTRLAVTTTPLKYICSGKWMVSRLWRFLFKILP